MYNLKKLHPIQIDDLVRIGNNFDGGYILSKRQIDATSVLLSFGINHDWSFETDFVNRNHAGLYAFDHSVSASFFERESKHYFKFMLLFSIFLKFSKAKEHRENALYFSNKYREFKNFFDNSARFFFPKFIGQQDTEKFVCFNTIFKDVLPRSSWEDGCSVFVKMDVENWEYRTLPQLVPYFDRINGLAVEFHELDIASGKFEEIIELLTGKFYIAHVHANNYGALIFNTQLPMALEITFINKSLIPAPVSLSTQHYPIVGLDFPNDTVEKDIELDFGEPAFNPEVQECQKGTAA
jgi:hypothetical protein